MFSKTNLNGQKVGPPSIISKNLIIKGNLKSEGEIQIDGKVEGDVTSMTLIIGEEGVVTGEIIAGKVLVRGKVKGQIRSQEVHLSKSAHVTGDIHHDVLGIESGAFVEGMCKRSKRPLENIESSTNKIKKIQQTQNNAAKNDSPSNGIGKIPKTA
ncbi:polymer-forming cytoskeletal protein [Alphaproteobacteria bacterium]|mgnify:CR=1 FL=1|nr:polymer-forming cytoskeletal protein [Alphaproteobacteria bacterium]